MSNSAEVLMTDGALKRQGDSLVPQGIFARAYRTTSVALAANWNQPAFEQKWDSGQNFNLSTNRFQPTVPGWYHISATATVNGANNAGELDLKVQKNSAGSSGGGTSAIYSLGTTITNGAAGWGGASASGTVYMNGVTDYLECFVWVVQSSILAGNSPVGAAFSFEGFLIGSSVGVIPEPWHYVGSAGEPGFQNAWVNYGTGDQSAAFYKDPHGVVRLKGIVKNGTIGSGSPVFTLPVGYRPQWSMRFAWISNSALAYGYITDTGLVACVSGSNAWLDFSGTNFRAEQ